MSVQAEGFVAGVTDAAVSGTPAASVQAVPVPALATPAPAGQFTETDIAKARQQEKDKLYPQIEALKERVAQIDAIEQQRAAADAARVAAEEQAARTAAEADLSAKDLLEQRTSEIMARLDEESNARKNAEALLQREREYQQLEAYKTAQVAANAEHIIPDLIDLVGGNTPEEIDASIAGLAARSAAILGAVQAAQQSARQDLPGTRTTLPAAGPMDTNLGTNQFSPEQIAAMSANEYAQHRSRLLGSAASGGGKGLFG
jgi:hypothetical protein